MSQKEEECECTDYVICMKHALESGHITEKRPVGKSCTDRDCLCIGEHEVGTKCSKCDHE